MHDRRRASAERRHTTTERSVQRSWRAVEPAAREAERQVIGGGSDRLANRAVCRGSGERRQNAGKTGMQAAARVGEAAAVMVLMVMQLALLGMVLLKVILRMVIVAVRRESGCRR